MTVDVKMIHHYVGQYDDISIMTVDEMTRLLPQLKSGDAAAQNRLIGAHIRLIVKMAMKRCEHSNLNLEDFVQEGIVGLFLALENYNPEKGVKFYLWAHPFILKQMTDLSALFAGQINIPARKRQLMYEVRRLQHEAMMTLQRRLTIDELATQMGKPSESIRNLYEEMKLQNTSDWTIVNEASVYKEAEAMTEEGEMERFLSELSPKEEYILRFHFGIGDGPGMNKTRSFKEIAMIFQVDEQQARTILDKTLVKLREYPELLGFLTA